MSEFPNKFNLKSVSWQLINQKYNIWLEKHLPWPLNAHDHKQNNIMIPHQINYNPSLIEIGRIKRGT